MHGQQNFKICPSLLYTSVATAIWAYHNNLFYTFFFPQSCFWIIVTKTYLLTVPQPAATDRIQTFQSRLQHPKQKVKVKVEEMSE